MGRVLSNRVGPLGGHHLHRIRQRPLGLYLKGRKLKWNRQSMLSGDFSTQVGGERMIDSDEGATRTLNAARELGPKIRAAADEIEQGRRLPMHLVREMQRAGMFRMAMPRAWGGPELDFLTQMRVIEA